MNCPICSKTMPPKTAIMCPDCWWALPGNERSALAGMHRRGNHAGVKSKLEAIVRGRRLKTDGANPRMLIVDDIPKPPREDRAIDTQFSVVGLSLEVIIELRHQYLIRGGKLPATAESVREIFERSRGAERPIDQAMIENAMRVLK